MSHAYNMAIRAAHEADVCDILLVDLRQRGCASPETIEVIRTRRNAADAAYREWTERYNAEQPAVPLATIGAVAS